MKNALLLLFFACCALVANAQDLITKRNGEDIEAKVLEITPEHVSFKRYDNLTGPLYTVPKSELLMIRYENGSKEIFEQKTVVSTAVPAAPAPQAQQAQPSEDMYNKGLRDANRYYTGHKGAATATLLTSALLGGFAGLVPAIITSSVPPKDRNLNIPNQALRSNPEYYQGYKQGATRKKSRKVWTNFGIGVAVGVVAYIVLTN